MAGPGSLHIQTTDSNHAHWRYEIQAAIGSLEFLQASISCSYKQSVYVYTKQMITQTLWKFGELGEQEGGAIPGVPSGPRYKRGVPLRLFYGHNPLL
jgi:hypothetical protein